MRNPLLALLLLALAATAANARLVSFTSDPPKVNVYVDGTRADLGRLLGWTEAGVPKVWDLPDGRHLIQATWPKWAVYHRYIEVCETCDNAIHIDMFYRVFETFTLGRALKIGSVDRPVDGRIMVHLADLNLDGRDDLVIADSEGRVYLAINDPGDREFLFPKLVPLGQLDLADGAGLLAPFLADWNADGQRDLLVGTARGRVVWLSNAATLLPEDANAIQQAVGIDLPFQYLRDDNGALIAVPGEAQPWVADWNADGLKDLLVLGRDDGRVRIYLNTGTAAEPVLALAGSPATYSDRPLAFGANATMYVVDIDYNLMMDFIVASDEGVTIYINNGTADDPLGMFTRTGRAVRLHTNKDGVRLDPAQLDLVPPYSIFFSDFIPDRRFLRDILLGDGSGRLLVLQGTHMVGDVNDDKQVQGLDLILLNRAIGTKKGDAGFNAEVDLSMPRPDGELQESKTVDTADRILMERFFGRHFTPCGNGVTDPGEECDDGNRLDEDGCSEVCTVE